MECRNCRTTEHDNDLLVKENDELRKELSFEKQRNEGLQAAICRIAMEGK